MQLETTDAPRAVTAFQEGAALIDLSADLATLAITGADARDYLQRMVSGDVRRVAATRGISATLMTAKARMIAVFEIYARGEELLLVVARSASDALQAALERLVILEDVTVVDDGLSVVSLQGPLASRMLLGPNLVAADAEDGATRTIGAAGDVLAARRARGAAGGWDLIGSSAALAPVVASCIAAGAVGAPAEVAEAFRIDAGIPRFGVDADDTYMPIESGYDAAISYDKGCYAGQEVVARVRTYGHANRLLRRIRLAGTALPAPGDSIRVAERDMGSITSACLSPGTGRGVALGYVRIKGGEVGTEVTVSTADGDLTGIVEALGAVAGAEPATDAESAPLLEIHDLRKSYRAPDGTVNAVLDIPAFTLAAGEQVALEGSSGSGKTTLLHIIAGILSADSGRVRVAEHDVSQLGEAARDAFRARNIGYVFQTFHLLQGYTALENVLLGMMFGPGRDDTQARTLLTELGLGDRMQYRPSQLSIGQQQRVALARALANRPRLVLADEPTGNLDARNAGEAMGLLRDACRQHNAALLLVSHDRNILDRFERVERLADLNRAMAGTP